MNSIRSSAREDRWQVEPTAADTVEGVSDHPAVGWRRPGGIWGRLAMLQLAILGPLLGLVLAGILGDSRRMIQHVASSAVHAALVGAERQQDALQNASLFLRILAELAPVRSGGPVCVAALQDAVAKLPQVASISVTNATGTTLCSSRPESVGLSQVPSGFLREALQIQSPVAYALSELRVHGPGRRPEMLVGIPLDRTANGGLIFAEVELDWFTALLRGDSVQEDTVLEVLDTRDGAIVARVPASNSTAGQRLPNDPVVKAFAQSRASGTVNGRDMDGTHRIFGFAPVPGPGPTLVMAVGLSADAVYAQAWRRTLVAGGFGLTVAILGMLLSRRMAKRNVVGPLHALSAAAARLGAGNLSSTVDLPDDAPSEFRALAAAFRRMVNRLQLRDQRIEAIQFALAQSEEEHRLLADTSNDIIARFAPDLRRVYVSPACIDILGYRPEQLIGQHVRQAVHPDDWQLVEAVLTSVTGEGSRTARVTYRAVRRDGAEIWLEASARSLGPGRGLVVVKRDVTDRKALEEQLASLNCQLSSLAREDALTGLANRRRFDEMLEQECVRAARSGEKLTVILLDVDRFKLFNDTYGHPEGDRCLRAVAAAVDGALHRPQDLAARYGGEEFAVLLPETGQDGAMNVALRIQAAIRGAALPHSLSRCGILTVSMGLACFSSGPGVADPAEIIRRADAALYQAKRDGRDRICFEGQPPPELSTEITQNLELLP